MRGNNGTVSRVGFFNRLAAYFAVFAAFAVGTPALADVALPPPSAVIANAPTGSTFNISYPKGLQAPPNIDQITQASNQRHYQSVSASLNGTSETKTAHKVLGGTFRDNFGATAQGKFSTTTTLPGNNTLANLGGALIVGQVGGNIANSSHAQQAAQELANGNYGSGLAHALAALDYTGLGQGINSLKDTYRAAVEAKAQNVRGCPR